MDDNIFDFDAEYQDILHEEFENEGKEEIHQILE